MSKRFMHVHGQRLRRCISGRKSRKTLGFGCLDDLKVGVGGRGRI